eukprot:tig00001067_g6775.t1
MEQTLDFIKHSGWPVDIASTPTQGRFAVLSRDAVTDEVVFHAYPFTVVPEDSVVKRVCAHCFSSNLEDPLPGCCPDCRAVYYCTPDCMEYAKWYHAGEECNALSQMFERRDIFHDHDENTVARILIQLMVRRARDLRRRRAEAEIASDEAEGEAADVGAAADALGKVSLGAGAGAGDAGAGGTAEARTTADAAADAAAGHVQELEKQIEAAEAAAAAAARAAGEATRAHDAERAAKEAAGARGRSRRRAALQIEEAMSYESIIVLMTHREHYSKDEIRDARVLVNKCKLVMPELFEDVDENELINDYCSFFTNSFAMWDASYEAVGVGIFPHASFFNHSCAATMYRTEPEPAVMPALRNRVLEFRMLMPQPKGTELAFCYTDSAVSVEQRQRHLQSRFYFTCTCSRCQLGPDERDEFIETYLCPKCDYLHPPGGRCLETISTVPTFVLPPPGAPADGSFDPDAAAAANAAPADR